MSLINDALKRAKETPPSAAPPKVAMETVDYSRPGLPVYFVPALLAIVCGAGFFLWKGWDQTRRLTAAYDSPTIVQARELQDPSDADAGPPGIPTGRNFSLEDDTPRAATVADATVQAVAAEVAEATAPAGSNFKLQGIFFRKANPSAVINAKTVFVGDKVANARVKAIDRETVTLECAGETRVLTLP